MRSTTEGSYRDKIIHFFGHSIKICDPSARKPEVIQLSHPKEEERYMVRLLGLNELLKKIIK